MLADARVAGARATHAASGALLAAARTQSRGHHLHEQRARPLGARARGRRHTRDAPLRRRRLPALLHAALRALCGGLAARAPLQLLLRASAARHHLRVPHRATLPGASARRIDLRYCAPQPPLWRFISACTLSLSLTHFNAAFDSVVVKLFKEITI